LPTASQLCHASSQLPLAYSLFLAIVGISIMRLSALLLNALFVFNRGFRFIGIIRLRNSPDVLLLSLPDYSMKFEQRGKLTDTFRD